MPGDRTGLRAIPDEPGHITTRYGSSLPGIPADCGCTLVMIAVPAGNYYLNRRSASSGSAGRTFAFYRQVHPARGQGGENCQTPA